MSTTDDRARLDEIEEGFAQSTSRFDQNFNEEIDFLIRVARDGLRWREAAAAEGEVEAALATWYPGEWPDDPCFQSSFNGKMFVDISRQEMHDTITAAAAWRAANAPKDDERGKPTRCRERLVVDDAMVERAARVIFEYDEVAQGNGDIFYVAEWDKVTRAALEAAFRSDANGSL